MPGAPSALLDVSMVVCTGHCAEAARPPPQPSPASLALHSELEAHSLELRDLNKDLLRMLGTPPASAAEIKATLKQMELSLNDLTQMRASGAEAKVLNNIFQVFRAEFLLRKAAFELMEPQGKR